MYTLTDLALVVADERAAVVLNHSRQVRGGELAVGNPARKLVVPHAVVTAEELAVCFREVGNLVTTRESECAARRFRRVLITTSSINTILSTVSEEPTHFMLLAGVI